jgi:hypothetical protein
MLTSDLKTPFVPETSVGSDFEKSFNVLSEFGLEDVGSHLEVLALPVISLPVEEPSGYSVPLGVVDDAGDGVALGLSELTSSELGVDSEDLADEESEPPSDSLDLVEGEGDCSLSVDVGVEDTVDVLKRIFGVFDDE